MSISASPAVSDEVATYVANRIGFIELERPKALNALSTGMIRAMHAALDQWRENPDVLAVVVRSQHPRAFCAGGDIRFLYESAQRGEHDCTRRFFHRGIPAQSRDLHLSEAVYRVDERRRDGRRHGDFAGRASNRRPARRDSIDQDGDARNPHRALSRCRRELVSGAHAGRDRPLSGGDRRDDRRGRCALRGSRRRLYRRRGFARASRYLAQRTVRTGRGRGGLYRARSSSRIRSRRIPKPRRSRMRVR